MKSSLHSLLVKAAQAMPPPARGSRSSWAPYVPVVEQLRKAGLNLTQSVNWLHEQGELPAERRNHAYRALRQLLLRRSQPPPDPSSNSSPSLEH